MNNEPNASSWFKSKKNTREKHNFLSFMSMSDVFTYVFFDYIMTVAILTNIHSTGPPQALLVYHAPCLIFLFTN